MRNIVKLCTQYNRIAIQMHDNPDGDSIGSAVGLQRLLESFGFGSEIVYSGPKISKPNLVMLIKENDINIKHIKLDDIGSTDYNLSIIVDAQLGESNITDLGVNTVIEIDHHQMSTHKSERVAYSIINSTVTACTTLIYDLYIENHVEIESKVGAFLYYGLLTDSNNFDYQLSPLDRDMVDYLEDNNLVEKFLINILIKENLKYEDLAIAQRAIMSYNRDEFHPYLAVVQVEPCEQNLLGYISDSLIEIAGVQIVVAFCKEDNIKYRLSIRSCDKFIKANAIIEKLTKNIGGGGGNLDKSGGVIFKNEFSENYPLATVRSFIESKIVELYNSYVKIETGAVLPVDIIQGKINKFIKKEVVLRYIKLEDYFEFNDEVLIRTLEGDVKTPVKNTYCMLGAQGEIYPCSAESFFEGYTNVDEPKADCDEGILRKDYKPKIKSLKSGNELILTKLQEFSTVRTKRKEISAVELLQDVKVLTKWDKSRPHSGDIGDYLVIGFKDFYIVDKDIFKKTYEGV